ncbi:MAG: hypothetical protein KGR26_01120 [Cyanobacteria bacterium REEB65]|nr:hypothetical protein [Cyanobacteria bacterium REEB65]
MPTEVESVIAELNTNISLEHGAIVQYLVTAYAMGEGEVGCEVINIARTEMRHLKMFGDLLVDLGGRPDMWRRGAMHLEAATAGQMMRNGIQAEDEAIAAYEALLTRIEHPAAQRVVERVLADERFHREQFAGFESEAAGLAAQYPVAPIAGLAAEKVVALLNPAVQAEYAQILRNVREYLLSREFRHRDRMLEPMIWAMKHVGLLADVIGEGGGAVNLVDLPVAERTYEEREALEVLLAAERDRLVRYSELVAESPEPGLQELLRNFQAHQRFNVFELDRERDRLAEQAQEAARRCPFHGGENASPTVGSLFGQGQT